MPTRFSTHRLSRIALAIGTVGGATLLTVAAAAASAAGWNVALRIALLTAMTTLGVAGVAAVTVVCRALRDTRQDLRGLRDLPARIEALDGRLVHLATRDDARHEALLTATSATRPQVADTLRLQRATVAAMDTLSRDLDELRASVGDRFLDLVDQLQEELRTVRRVEERVAGAEARLEQLATDRRADAHDQAMREGFERLRTHLTEAIAAVVAAPRDEAVLRAVQSDLATVRELVAALSSPEDPQGPSEADLEALGTLLSAAHDELEERVAARLGSVERRLRESVDAAQREVSEGARLVAALSHGVAIPPSGGWAITADLAMSLFDEVIHQDRELAVELGSGLSTLVLGAAMKQRGTGRVIAIEHDETYLERTREAVASLDLDGYVEVLHAPLMDVTVGETTHRWYDLDRVALPSGIDLLFVDGPPAHAGPDTRYPALPLLAPRLAAACTVVVDDADRPEERRMVERWTERFPDFAVRRVAHRKGTAVLERTTRQAFEALVEANR